MPGVGTWWVVPEHGVSPVGWLRWLRPACLLGLVLGRLLSVVPSGYRWSGAWFLFEGCKWRLHVVARKYGL